VLLLSGALTYIKEGEGSGAAALIAAGLVVLGALTTIEVISWYHRMLREHRRSADEMRRTMAEIERLDGVVGQMLDEDRDEEQR